MTADETGDEVADSCRHEPHAHHLTLELGRRELRHRAEPHRTQRQLAECLEEVAPHEPPRRQPNIPTSVNDDLRSFPHHDETEAGEEESPGELGNAGWILPAPPERDPKPRE